MSKLSKDGYETQCWFVEDDGTECESLETKRYEHTTNSTQCYSGEVLYLCKEHAKGDMSNWKEVSA